VKPVTQIISPDNEVYRGLRDSLESKGIHKHGQFMVFGAKAVRDTLKLHGHLARNLVLCHAINGGGPLHEEIQRLAGKRSELKAPSSFSTLELAEPLYDQLDIFGTRNPILVMQTPAITEIDLTAEPPQGLEILCALSDPANFGALLRSAAAFGARRVIMLKECTSPFHPRAVRAASATTLLTELARGPAIRDLTLAKGPIGALDMTGAPLTHFQWPKDVRLLLGEEGMGVPRELSAPKMIQIPMAPGVESLNATVAASIALFSYRSQFTLKYL
jgi:TrmH family RNA methyltransferase